MVTAVVRHTQHEHADHLVIARKADYIHIRDVTYAEDASQIRTSRGPQVMAALPTLPNLAISIFATLGTPASRPPAATTPATPPTLWQPLGSVPHEENGHHATLARPGTRKGSDHCDGSSSDIGQAGVHSYTHRVQRLTSQAQGE
jgi:hypothetical protein